MPTPADHPAIATLRHLLARHLPERADGAVTPLGAGLDNTTFDVDGDLVARFSRDPDPVERARQVRREARLLTGIAARSPLPTPVPVVIAAGDGCLVYRKLPGRPVLDLVAERRTVLAADVGAALGRLLAALAAIPPEEAAGLVDPDDTAPAAWLGEALVLAARLGDAVPARHRPAVRAFLDAEPPEPAPRLVFSHNDLGIEHVLVDPGTSRITGILDWTDAALTDPARDLGLILRDLGPPALDAALAAYGPEPDDAAGLRRRIVFLARCALLEDLVHGLATGQDAYVKKSLIGMCWLFPG
ncbi:phosphotransferase family protein [Geodermatophilus sabuli]|uniref:Predicted kinase, aminoglycoside phosphotransferase (APT) family n=1 Tax=Geodermatophilus sabuli TaxID=1564158 RepID=A0A285E694_9ACTN|nr:aminoglycoside phosphotransferase family protein [Geodermatophilus sabuli]MBB3082644.1 aminoglycoside phosphotransferase (APT) family kinase protein [Geodermatophilus sabuli]SNX94490.1 Predicted kinase, aminoglycoside phosphotransferase (APT) family [Geodermatophilus sabuli]